mmetsp:Transcript_34041/g.83443  ORF Transcript_34041/g.83443 Transcript_34041/m.83443 type:complete len:186 (-) Transcript_34041:986-1543(-)
MGIVITEEPWVPKQETFVSGADFRDFKAGRASRKRAREIEEHGHVIEQPDHMKLAIDEHELERLRKASRPTYEQVNGKASGRSWKAPQTRANTFMKPQASKGIKTWDDRMKEKKAKKAFQDQMKDVKDASKAERKTEHLRRAAKKTQKEENRKRTGIITQDVTNSKTLAKQSSKERKKLKKLKML